MRIDAHQHFWKFDPIRDSWITPDMDVIRRDFLPSDLIPLLRENSIDGCVAVQADQSEEETRFLLQQAREHEAIMGVVGWTNLRSGQLNEQLAHFAQIPKVKGFRHIVQNEPPGFLHDQKFIEGVRQLEKYDFAYDLLIYPHQLEEATSFIRQLPHQRIVIDHLAKPYIKKGEIALWKKHVAACASFENAWCKISGLVTEADWNDWNPPELAPYLDVVLELFGPNRLMFGSDWPVCLLAASYPRVLRVVEDYIATLSREEKTNIMGENAIRFYNL